MRCCRYSTRSGTTLWRAAAGPVVEALHAQRAQHRALHGRVLGGVRPVEAHRLAQGDRRVGDEARGAAMVLRHRVPGRGVHEDDVAQAAGGLHEARALRDQGRRSRSPRAGCPRGARPAAAPPGPRNRPRRRCRRRGARCPTTARSSAGPARASPGSGGRSRHPCASPGSTVDGGSQSRSAPRPRLTMKPSPQRVGLFDDARRPPRSSQAAAHTLGAKSRTSRVAQAGHVDALLLPGPRVAGVVAQADPGLVQQRPRVPRRVKQPGSVTWPCSMKDSTWSSVRTVSVMPGFLAPAATAASAAAGSAALSRGPPARLACLSCRVTASRRARWRSDDEAATMPVQVAPLPDRRYQPVAHETRTGRSPASSPACRCSRSASRCGRPGTGSCAPATWSSSRSSTCSPGWA